MRRRVVLVAALAVLVSLAVATASYAVQPHQSRHSQAQPWAPAGLPSASATSPTASPTIPLRTVDGVVRNADGSAVSGAIAKLYFEYEGTFYYFDYDVTDASGVFSFSGVPAPSVGEIDVYLSNGNTTWTTGLSITAAGPNTFTLRPGLVGVSLLDTFGDGDIDWSSPFLVELYGGSGGGGTWLEATSGNAVAMPTNVTYGVMYPTVDRWKFDRGIEASVDPAIAVTAGVTGGAIAFEEANARDAALTAPFWASGKAGSVVKISLTNFPAGQTILVRGYSDSPREALKTWAAFTADGTTMTKSFTIPSTVPVGYTYWLECLRADGDSRLALGLPFQVAKLTSSKTVISRGSSITVSGVVPTNGHVGTKVGQKKRVVVYKRTSSAGVPTAWDATTKGWTRVGTYVANGLGVFKTGALRPTRTTYYVARYDDDAYYHEGYTSVLKVYVK